MTETMTPPPPPAPPGDSFEPPAARGLPFEDPQQPFLDGFVETVKLMVTAPRDAYRMMEAGGDIVRPLIYAVLLGWIGIIAGQVYNLLFQGAMLRALASRIHGIPLGGSAITSVAILVLAPIIIIVGLFIWAGLVHLSLILVGGATRGFVATFKALAYAQTSSLAQLVPMCGGIIGLIWALVLQVFGIAAAHDTSEGKAVVAVLLPIVVCCLCGVIASVLFGVGIASLASSHN